LTRNRHTYFFESSGLKFLLLKDSISYRILMAHFVYLLAFLAGGVAVYFFGYDYLICTCHCSLFVFECYTAGPLKAFNCKSFRTMTWLLFLTQPTLELCCRFRFSIRKSKCFIYSGRQSIPPAYNKAFAKYGLDNQTCTSTKWQLWFGLDGFNLAFIGNLYCIFSI